MNVPRLTAQVIDRVLEMPMQTVTIDTESKPGPADLSWRDTPWTTANGQTKPICELSDSHIRNIIFYLHRETGYKCKSDGMSAREIIGYAGVWDKRTEVYDLMLREAEYRKLSWY